MPIIGNPSRFAVEYWLDSEYAERLLLIGRLCFWVRGQSVGDPDSETPLRDFIFALERIRRYHGRRQNSRLFAKSALEIIANIEQAGNFSFARHDLSPASKPFEGWDIYLIESEISGRVVTRSPAGEILECELAAGECARILERTLADLGGLYLDEIIRVPVNAKSGRATSR